MNLLLYNFFPDRLNLYGDRGNVIAFQKRCEWRGIQLEVVNIKSTNSINLSQVDLLFIGGGSDREQGLVTHELLKIKKEFKSCIEDGVGCLAICGGYQLLGNYYVTSEGNKYMGLDICDFYSVGQKNRMVGNIAIESKDFGNILGFENHSGRTYHPYESLGKVIKGFGNNGNDGTEGLYYKNVIGTYLHGPLLPKNPALADQIISSAIERKYGRKEMIQLDDTLENETKHILEKICLKH
ncbi:glutamine amidotransferase [Paenibacillus sp. SYP-B3998]|uniref:Lipid II isoglutaminyl synthase (glutamine-hydrolyzing) subunit GatD n=2 Tax=Paenibacillus sp. SYP-B3998 TaxID=2678564 RepID=A0A6G3ZUN7_9BACL|nr:glutamine amidotransferase [Paenibacillus sp. SYP-B3998]NEW05852.1 glutamine amidotransferase [Paenibacillus sp. SYP-B3998]